MDKIYLIANNNKKFDAWAKEKKKKLKGIALDSFNAGYNELMANAPYLVRASFISYWEINANGSLARVAPAITQATLLHLMHNFLNFGKLEEARIVEMMSLNFLRLMQALDQIREGEEEDEEE